MSGRELSRVEVLSRVKAGSPSVGSAATLRPERRAVV